MTVTVGIGMLVDVWREMDFRAWEANLGFPRWPPTDRAPSSSNLSCVQPIKRVQTKWRHQSWTSWVSRTAQALLIILVLFANFSFIIVCKLFCPDKKLSKKSCPEKKIVCQEKLAQFSRVLKYSVDTLQNIAMWLCTSQCYCTALCTISQCSANKKERQRTRRVSQQPLALPLGQWTTRQ